MNSPEHDELLRELELFREEARRMGVDPDRAVANLETADEFLARMRAQDAGAAIEEPQRSDTFSRRRRRWIAAGATVAAASTAILAGIFAPPTPSAVAETPPILDYEFASAVRIAYAGGEDAQPAFIELSESARQTPEPARNGDSQFKLKDSWFAQEDGSDSKIVPKIRKTWLLPDGGLLSETTLGAALRSDGRGLSSAKGAPRDAIIETEPAGTYDTDLADRLPTQPDRLRSVLLEASGCETDEPGARRAACLYREVLFLFQNYVVSQKSTAAIWLMLSSEEGFVTLGTVEDRAGRNGVGLSIIDPDRPEYRQILIASDETGQPLGYEKILIERVPGLDVPAPSVVAFSAFLDSRWEQSPSRS